jgi:hypothetical protein
MLRGAQGRWDRGGWYDEITSGPSSGKTLQWTRRAKADLEAIALRIGADDPAAARRTVIRIRARMDAVQDFGKLTLTASPKALIDGAAQSD